MSTRQEEAARVLAEKRAVPKAAAAPKGGGILGSIAVTPTGPAPKPETAVAEAEAGTVEEASAPEVIREDVEPEPKIWVDLQGPGPEVDEGVAAGFAPLPTGPAPVIDRVGMAGASAEFEPVVPRPAPAPVPTVVVPPDAATVIESVDELDASVFAAVPDEQVREYLRQAVQAVRVAVAVARARGTLPERELSLVIVDSPSGRSHAQVFGGDMTVGK